MNLNIKGNIKGLSLLLLGFIPFYVSAQNPTPEELNALVEKAQIQRDIQAGKAPAPPGGAVAGATAGEANAEATGPNPSGPPPEIQENIPKPPTLRDQAFKQLLDRISPLTPEQIIEMRKAQDKTQQAVATTPNTPPKPVSSTLTIDLSPGVTPPVIRLAAGFVTSMVFVDSTGQPWPIADYSLGNPKNFNIQWDKKTNTMFTQSNTAYSTANLAIRLATLDTPVMLSLVSGQKDVDYRVDLQVQGRGPNALAIVTGDQLPVQNPVLLNILDGVPPSGSIELEVSGCHGRAWLWNGRLFFRSQLTILSPAWSATVSSADGTHVFEMVPTPLILASENGKPIKIILRGI